MRLLAAAAVGTCCALLAAHLTGTMPRLRRPSGPGRRAGALRLWLQQAGVAVTPWQFVAGSAGAGAAAGALLTALCGSPYVAAVPAAGVALVPRAYFGRRRLDRMRRVQAAWPDGLRDLLASIGAGRSLSQAVEALAATGPPPLREALARFPSTARMLGTVAALEIVKEELADPTSDRVLEVLVVAHERGGGIVRAILADLAAATTRDLKLLDALETEGLEMKINARAVIVLPWLVLVLLTLSDGPFRDFYRSGAGVAVLLAGAALSAVGALVLGRLDRSPVEARVLAPVAGGAEP